MRFIAVLLVTAVTLLFASSAAAQQATMPAPSVRLAIGMTVDEIRAGSTYPFGPDPSAGGAHIGVYEISQPYRLVLLTGDKELAFDDVGMANQSGFFVITEGRLTNFTLPAQRELLTLDDAINRAQALVAQLKAAGFAEDRAAFQVQNFRRGAQRPTIGSFGEARAALADGELMIAEMSLFSGKTADLGASISILSGPRMLRLAGGMREESEVDVALRELRQGREWSLNLSVGDLIEPIAFPQ